jgi:DNA-binding MarR family transcriptional regulator
MPMMIAADQYGVAISSVSFDGRALEAWSERMAFGPLPLTGLVPMGYTCQMQQLAEEITSPAGSTAGDCAALLLDVAPLVMRRVRGEMRRQAEGDLSVPLFRTLRFLLDHPGATVSDVASVFSMTAPTASKLVQKLVERGIVERKEGEDRRRAHLWVTAAGRATLAQAHQETARQLERSLETLSPAELATVTAALATLRRAFLANAPIDGNGLSPSAPRHLV